MAKFSFTARDRAGMPRDGVLEQPTIEAAIAALRGRDWLVLEVNADESDNPGGDLLTLLRPKNWLSVRSIDVEISLRQIAVMLGSGLALLDSIRMLYEHAERRSLQAIWQSVAEAVLGGSTMAEAMESHRCFPPVAIQLTRVGEQTGELNVTLRRAADILEQRRKLRNQILSAMAYPTIVFVAAIAVSAFMVFNVIPKLQNFLNSLGRDLPPMTQMLVTVTQFANEYAVHGAVGLVFLIAGLVALRMWPPGRLWSDKILLRVPVFGSVLRVAGSAAFARNLHTLLQSGVSLLDGLQSIERLIGNRYLAQQLAACRDSVVGGSTLAEAIRVRGFTPMLARIVAIGESAGRLDEVLEEAAIYYEDQLSRSISRMAALVEPMMLLIVGGIVGFVYISFFMALFAVAG